MGENDCDEQFYFFQHFKRHKMVTHDRAEDITEKGENASYQHVLFLTIISKDLFFRVNIKWNFVVQVLFTFPTMFSKGFFFRVR